MKLVIFSQDLRINDNPALFFACQKAIKDNQEILPIFILDETNRRPLGGASKWFLHFSLQELQKNLQEKLALQLLVFKGDALKILEEIFIQKKVSEVYFNDLVEPDAKALQEKITDLAAQRNIQTFKFFAYLLFKPEEIKNGQGSYFKVFTPFWKHCLKNWELVKEPLKVPALPHRFASSQLFTSSLQLSTASSLRKSGSILYNKLDPDFRRDDHKESRDDSLKSKDCYLENWDSDVKIFDNHKEKWAKKLEKFWEFDNQRIIRNFQTFLKTNLKNYKENRNFPALNKTSKLSPYLHFGLISIRQVVDLIKNYYKNNPLDKEGTACFLSEIGWREFSHHLLFHFPQLPKQNFKKQFDNFTWENNSTLLKKWQQGKTGYPIVDAGMKELWQNGFMHNRVRMIVASFLIKDLLIDWRKGEEWFWDCLVDANLSNNSASWQWVAGSGADAAPYFRIFNPVLQGEKFDPDGTYVKKYLPVLKNLPQKFLHQPWKLSREELRKYGVVLGENYPHRIVIHEEAKKKALALYKKTND
jgi:deoxyribodipyrimidine photo-lyase